MGKTRNLAKVYSGKMGMEDRVKEGREGIQRRIRKKRRGEKINKNVKTEKTSTDTRRRQTEELG